MSSSSVPTDIAPERALRAQPVFRPRLLAHHVRVTGILCAALTGVAFSASGSYRFIPLQSILESTDLVVQGEVVKEVIERTHLVESICTKEPGPCYVTVTLRVIESYPPLE